MSTSIIKPTTITDSMLVSSSAAETDYPVWATGTYAVGDKRIMTTGIHNVYECLVAHTATTSADAPNLNTATATPHWLELSPTNRWAMFDRKVGTITSVASPLTVVLTPGRFNSIAFMGMVGRSVHVLVKSAVGGVVIYDRTLSLDHTYISDIYDWFFLDYEQTGEINFLGIPDQYVSPELTITVSASTGNVECGIASIGMATTIGMAQYGAKAGVTDYSVKVADAFGNYDVVERKYSKRASFNVITSASDFTKVHRFLAGIRATPCVYIAVDSQEGYEPLSVYGFWKSFDIDIAYPTHHVCSLEIEEIK